MSEEESSSEQVAKRPFILRIFIRFAIISGLGAIVAGLGGLWWIDLIGNQQGPHDEHQLLYVEPGDGRLVLMHKLAREGVISEKFHYQIFSLWHRNSHMPKAGEYLIEAGASLNQIMAQLDAGKTYQRRLTIIEGLRSVDVVSMLEADEMLKGAIISLPPEGSLFPDTYFYSRGDDRLGLLERMQQQMEIKLAEIWAERAPNLPFSSANDLAVLASIIEKETGLDEERDLVASVFINRLRKNMPLQSDPTVAYGLSDADGLKTSLSRTDLKTPHRWNSYLNKGLPPTPIANPSYASVYAAAHPRKSDYLYFVADAKGGHLFARTLAEHNRNVRIYRNRIKAVKQQAGEQ